jgi:hypothetical protein
MTDPSPAPASADQTEDVPAAPVRSVRSVRSDRVAALKACGLLIAAMAVVGALLGIVWELWSPAGPAGAVLSKGIQADESEAFIAGDGRFALITVLVGIAAALVAWYVRPFRFVRGPLIALALAVGGVVGAALTEWIGYLVRGHGTKFACSSETGKCIDHLPLTVHMHALLLVEAIVALLVYSLFAAFAVSDDLGRAAPADVAAPAPPPSSGAEHDPQQRWGHGDGTGPP